MSKPIEYGRPWWEVMKEVTEENARLKAEVEMLRNLATKIDAYVDVLVLKAEVERLRKAGDAMATNIPRMVTCQVTAHEAVDFMNDWNAAKEGKPSV